jgi:hypothetical protein
METLSFGPPNRLDEVNVAARAVEEVSRNVRRSA